MNRGTYVERKNQLKWRVRVGWIIGIVFGLFLSWTVIGLWIGYKGYKMAENASNERVELENEWEQYQNGRAQSAVTDSPDL